MKLPQHAGAYALVLLSLVAAWWVLHNAEPAAAAPATPAPALPTLDASGLPGFAAPPAPHYVGAAMPALNLSGSYPSCGTCDASSARAQAVSFTDQLAALVNSLKAPTARVAAPVWGSVDLESGPVRQLVQRAAATPIPDYSEAGSFGNPWRGNLAASFGGFG